MHDKTVLITGASSGIGRACAEVFAREGARLILAARREDRLADLTGGLAVKTLPLALDVRNRAAVEETIAGLPAAWADIDVLVNNADLSLGLETLYEGAATDWEDMIDTNIKGLLWLTRAVVPGMVARDRGHVINIGSVSGHDVYPGGAVYCATKFAVHAITTGLRIDLKGTRVRCSTVDPGMVESEFSLVRFHGDDERADAVYRNYPPLQPEDVAEAVMFCATRPPHVNIGELILWPTDQKSVTVSHPRGVD
ncbi:SDR family NAD(P)-dependent oxidoreductase [bacterium]|nr:SDR family NAD(P)-dependent oxidoreductase [bacterium]